jgi:hypothetical protein
LVSFAIKSTKRKEIFREKNEEKKVHAKEQKVAIEQ